MSIVESQFQSVLKPLVHSESNLVVALSGGLDSMVLLQLSAAFAREQRLKCCAIHVHHGLSNNADEWAEVCKKVCEQLGVEIITEHVSLDLSHGESVEQLARSARYQALEQHMTPQSLLLTGQHGDDQLETFLLALKRGSGPKGLASMGSISPMASGLMVRPLLNLSRQELEAWATKAQLQWVEDESNQDQRFDRNFIRHSVTPALKARWPNILQSTVRTAALCAEQEALLDELLRDKLDSSVNGFGGLLIEDLTPHTEVYRFRLVRMWLASHGELMPSQAQMHQLWSSIACAQPDANPQLKLARGTVRRFQGALYWVESFEDVTHWSQSLTLTKTLLLPDGLGELGLQKMAQADAPCSARVGILRAPAPGEDYRVVFDPTGLSAHPEARQHSRKLKKLFQEYGVPSWLRRRTPIIMSNEQVVAVVGLFVDQRFSGQDIELIWHREIK
ncbi:tRNA lysidine(34) synthetase TilS [Vibrio astriarenae]|uniref:tRNA(Ile)-lysidine synthase n=1 Tax=Vibrio astriarenae TaxID=1481923 RepID=A0A7Z2T4B9_9VIBR|nr:tRNA lysidine(34) synthetase TilS [Vibrio astriarenae]QIA63967.1 tRNA lysidine(34) synthetase TilS [Vibrio astriarenae]